MFFSSEFHTPRVLAFTRKGLVDAQSKKVVASQAAPAKVAPAQAEEVPEPTKRASRKAAEPAPKKDFVDVLNTWTTDDE